MIPRHRRRSYPCRPMANRDVHWDPDWAPYLESVSHYVISTAVCPRMDAEDLQQEAWLRTLRRCSGRPSWAIVRSEMRRILSEQWQAFPLIEGWDPPSPDPGVDVNLDFKAVCGRLPRPEGIVLKLSLRGFNNVEISRKIGVTGARVGQIKKVALARARRILHA